MDNGDVLFRNLPRDLLMKITFLLPESDVLMFGRCSKYLHKFCTSESLWKGYYQENFPESFKVLSSSTENSDRFWYSLSQGGVFRPEHMLPANAYSFPYKESTPTQMAMHGSCGVGKSALTVQFLMKVFIEYYDPTIEDSYDKEITYCGEKRRLSILDTAGMDEFHMLRNQWEVPKRATAVIYSVTSRSSFEDVPALISQLQQHFDEIYTPIVLVGNKSDLVRERKVSYVEGLRLAQELKLPFLETSAKTRKNVELLFHLLIDQDANWRARKQKLSRSKLVQQRSQKNKDGCCLQ